ncbi:hypothetical protein FRX31_007160 [Thalictrum thalictroides]|uniref:Uncharacterized protein n=1 Tax=Thalictrum thalictroides TaxID=46969 RepID=A0A7J6X1P6_THATH|nr:hypothetical protein FRX31_007160 [Thalictrum thalictroides]
MQLQGLLAALRKNWPTLKAGDQDAIFWSEQWYKHGIYSEMEQAAYFQKTLDLFAKVGENLEDKLEAESVPPNGQPKTYKLKDVEAALEKVIGVNCRVICIPSKMNRNVELIQEVRISYATNFEPQDTLESSRCKSDVLFPI